MDLKPLMIHSPPITKIFLLNIDTAVGPHYYLRIMVEGDVHFLVLCTSDQQGNNMRWAKLKGLESTMVVLSPSTTNKFPKETIAKCNNIIRISHLELLNAVIRYTGDLSDLEIQLVVSGLLSSPLLEGKYKSKIREFYNK